MRKLRKCSKSCGATAHPRKKFINYEKRAITLGIIGIVISFIFSIVGCIVSGFGIYYGSKEYKFTGKTSGLILSIIGMICSVIATLIGFWLLEFILTTVLSLTATASAVGDSFYLINAILSTLNDAVMKISNFISSNFKQNRAEKSALFLFTIHSF